MKLSDYELANCKLYRTPSVNFAKVGNILDELLVQAWQNNSNIESSLENILEDETINGTLSQQLQESLDFQRKNLQSNIDEKNQVSLNQLKTKYQDSLSKIDDKFEFEKTLINQELDSNQELYDSQEVVYSASQRELDEMKLRIKDKLKELGGAHEYDNLMNIYSVLHQKTPINEKKTSERSKKSSLDKTLRIVTLNIAVDPLNKKLHDSIIKRKTTKKLPIYRRVGKAIWNILTYEVW